MEKTIDTLRKAVTQIETLIEAIQRFEESVVGIKTALGYDGKPPDQKKSLLMLSKRQLEIFYLMKKDLSTADISKELKISQRTVNSHFHTIRQLLKFESMHDLRAFARSMES